MPRRSLPPPRRRISFTVASMVPPVASRSSTTSTLSPRLDSINVNFQLIGAVFQLIALSNGFTRQFARLTHRHKTHAHRQRNRCAKQEATGFSTYYFGDPGVFITLNQQFNAEGVRFRVFQQAGDIAEKNAEVLDSPRILLMLFFRYSSCCAVAVIGLCLNETVLLTARDESVKVTVV